MANVREKTNLNGVDKFVGGLLVTGLSLVAASCGRGEADRVVSGLIERPGAPIAPGLATGFATGERGLTPRFGKDAGPASARLVFPKQSNGRVHLEDAASGVVVAFRVRGARSVDAEAGDGYVVYRGAHESGATLLHRALPSGTEDYLAFDTRPAAPNVTYELALGPNVAGLRLVEGTLEMLDRDGAPRLRVEPPFLVGADGARVGAALAVEGCAVDGNPAGPWGREVTPPGADSCAVVVTWPDAEVRYPAVLDPRWTTTGSMASVRQDHTATLLPLTGKVLVVGGRTSGTSTTGLPSAELYDPASGTWSPTSSISGGRWSHSATVLNSSSNGTTSQKVLIAGGINGTASLNTAQLYSQTAGTWASAGTLNAARHLHTATLLADGRVLVAGGMSGTTVLTSAALYNPASGSGSWTATTGMIPPPGWRSGTATLLQTSNAQLNNKVLLAGGNNGTSTVGSAFLFDPTQSAFSTLASMPSAREGQTALTLANGKILLAGGKNGSSTLATAVIFDPSSGPGSWSTTGSMTSARSGHTASLLPTSVLTTGQVLVAGGSNGTSTLGSTEVWSGSTWAASAAMVAPVQQHRAVVLGSKVLIAGGVNGSTTVSASELYDPSFGLSCTTGTQCASGFCANGVCCDTACNSGCGACNLTGKVGTCSPVSSGTSCRAAAGECDVAETCSGTSTSCPADAKKPSGTACTDDGNACTKDQCDGSNVACQHPAGNAGTTCRASVGACDVAEVCSGTSASCPADGFAPAGTVCAAANGNQGAETCSGNSAFCPESGEAADVLGFETEGDWHPSDGNGVVIGENATHTQGLQSMEVTAQGFATFTSTLISSIGSSGTLLLLDIMLPVEDPPNPSWSGSADIAFSAPSIGINNHSAGQVDLSALPHGQWETLGFQLPAADAAKLSAGGYSDLTFNITLNTPSTETGHFLLDNLRAVAADVVPTLLGIATNTAGVTKAVFTYTTTATSVQIPYGEGNALLDANNAFIASPTETPPQTFLSGTHGPFVATLTGSALTWRIGTHTATATPASTPLSTTPAGDGTLDANLPGGGKVNIDSTPPQDPTASADPPIGDPDVGVLKGDLQISPSGAAVYTLPLRMAPGVANMAPNLSLVYNSQSANGIVGQGWALSGLSTIHKCPRTKQQDGVARPVTMSGDPTSTSGTNTDGICLDGQRLFEAGSFTYVPEKKDFTTITYFPSDNHFEVTTKDNQIRYYGLTAHARLTAHGLDSQNNTTTGTAIWALERIRDAWGNFLYVHYNTETLNQDPTQSGLLVTEIDYTGHMTASGTVDTNPFASVKFTYVSRSDVRWMRFAVSKFPVNQLMKTITNTVCTPTGACTALGTYTLSYDGPSGSKINTITNIHYCTGATCLKDLTFGWTGGDASWTSSTGYALPSTGVTAIPTGHGLTGAQFVDLDRDGRTDLVYAGPNQAGNGIISTAWLNTTTGWVEHQELALPPSVLLATQQGVPTGVRFADMDGDGVPDLVQDTASPPGCTTSGGCFSVWLNRYPQNPNIWELHPEFAVIPSASTFSVMRLLLTGDPITVTCINGNACTGFNFKTFPPAVLVDVNNDGRMDVVRVEQGGSTPGFMTATMLEILINQGPGANPAWSRAAENVLTDVTLDFSTQPAAGLFDLNRDGFPDLLQEGYRYSNSPVANQPNQLLAFQRVALNQSDSGGAPQFATTLSRASGTGRGFLFAPSIADLDGDGLYDEVLFGYLNPINHPDTDDLASGYGVGMNDGAGARLSYAGDAQGYAGELSSLSPTRFDGPVFDEDYAYAIADLNGDGLPDLIRNHYNCINSEDCDLGAPINVGGGEMFYNLGTTWGTGADQWHRDVRINSNTAPVPGVIPSPITAGCGGAFIDLNGDGVVDFIQEEGTNGTTCNGSKVGRGAWLNSAGPPVLNTFPNSRAKDTAVFYVHITEPGAHTANVACDGVNTGAVYCDDGSSFDANTKTLAAPVQVAFKVTKEDKSGNGSTVDTTYAYHSLRADTNGRGALGFQRVTVYDHASGVKTETTYNQGYPYTGMPAHVVRTQVTQNNAPLDDTTTHYCDSTAVGSNGTVSCSGPGTTFPPQTSLFVYPSDVVNIVNVTQDASGNQQYTESTFKYDDFGNAKQVVVTTTTSGPSTAGSTAAVTTTNQYGTAGSQEEAQGKATDVQISATGDLFLPIVGHHTSFTYAPVNTFGGASSTALALSKKELEPGSGWPLQEDTAYLYDPFGNVTVTTTCANDFASCAPSVTSPSPVAVDHPPFRTTTTSYNTGDFNAPAGPGLISSLPYGSGRFPVKTTTNAIQSPTGGGAEHDEYHAYDPMRGLLLQKTDPDGVHTCYTYDDLGRSTSEVSRCGSSAPIQSTTAYLKIALVGIDIPTPAPGTPFLAATITVKRSASGAATWTFEDDQGKPMETVSHNFGGGFNATLTTYDVLGRVVTATKPFLLQNFADSPPTTYKTTTIYDGFNRVSQVAEDLGPIGGGTQLVTTTTYNGLSTTVTRTADGVVQTRTETKNALGKLQSVVDSLGQELDYQYDCDGNVIAVQKADVGNLVVTSYDARGRKTQMTDTDLGTWNFTADGFGDLVSQTDANNQQFVMTYDQLGRMLTKQNLATGATAQWIYDTAGGAGIGKIAAMVGEADPNLAGSCGLPAGATVSGGNRAVKAYAYTAFGDLQSVSECADGATFQTSYETDSIGRQNFIHYPVVSGKQLTVGYHYTNLGFLHYLSDESSDYGILWQAKAMDTFGNMTDEQARNGVETVQNRSPGNGWQIETTSTAHADGNTVIQDWVNTFDEVGNLLGRNRFDVVADAVSSEGFSYDALNRVTTEAIVLGAPVDLRASNTYAYDGNGNLWQKDGNTFTYGGCQGPGRSGSGVHQICSINGGPSFVYDAAGNLMANGDRTITYNAHNKVTQVTNGTGTTKFMYGADDNRVVESVTSGGTTTRTVYVGLGGTGKSMFERVTKGSTITYTNFIYAGGEHSGNAFAIRLTDSGGNPSSTRYLNFDHLGSTTAVSDEKGHVASATGSDTQVLGYDAWGARRNPDGAPATSALSPSVGNRDFTGQETVPVAGLINMNGRMYDPLSGRFLSPDPHVKEPGNLENYNRYTYALNNPLRYTDPTGLDFWGGLESYFSNPMNVAELLQTIMACGIGGPAFCFVVGIEMTVFNTTCALVQGASVENTLISVAIGLSVSLVTSSIVGAYLGPNANPIWGIVTGAVSAAGTTAAVDGFVYHKDVGWDAFWAGAIAAAQGAASYGVQKVSDLIQTVKVRLALDLKFVDKDNNPLPDAEANKYLQAAQKEWTGRFGKYDVTAVFNDQDARAVTVVVDSGGGGGQPVTTLHADGVGDTIHIYTKGYVDWRTPFTPNTLQDNFEFFGHEIGHALGANDQYIDGEVRSSVFGHAYDVMGPHDSGATFHLFGSPSPFPSTIEEIQSHSGLPYGGVN